MAKQQDYPSYAPSGTSGTHKYLDIFVLVVDQLKKAFFNNVLQFYLAGDKVFRLDDALGHEGGKALEILNGVGQRAHDLFVRTTEAEKIEGTGFFKNTHNNGCSGVA